MSYVGPDAETIREALRLYEYVIGAETMSLSYHRGHLIYMTQGDGQLVPRLPNIVWRYWDNGEPTETTNRPCGHCGIFKTEEGHDPCLGTLPGVMNACCGHGRSESTYVQLADGTRLSGQDATDFIEMYRTT